LEITTASLPSLPCLAGWVPEQRQASFAEPLQQAFIERDCPDGVMASIKQRQQDSF